MTSRLEQARAQMRDAGIEIESAPDPERLRGGPSRVGAPAAPAVERVAAGWDESALVEEQEAEIRLPVIPGARVVYLGPSKKMSKPLVGAVNVEPPDPETGHVEKSCTLDGQINIYDFTVLDARNRPIPTRLAPMNLPARMAHLRGKPTCVVEHPEHLRWFFRYRNANKEKEFEIVIADPVLKARWIDYVAQAERKLGRQLALQTTLMNEGVMARA